MSQVGASTTFFGFRGGLLPKVEKLCRIFDALSLPPYIELLSEPGDDYGKLVRRLRLLKESYGVEYSVHQSMWLPSPNFYLNLGSSNREAHQATLDSLKKSIDFARDTGAPGLSFHPGCAWELVAMEREFEPPRAWNSIPYTEAYANLDRGLEELHQYAGTAVALSLENLSFRPERRYLLSRPQDFDRLRAGMGIVLDLGHAYYSSVKLKDSSYMAGLVNAVSGKVKEIHLSDNDGLEDEHMLAGKGKVPMVDLLRQIAMKQGLPPLIIEAHKGNHGYSEEDLRETIHKVGQNVSEMVS